MQGTELKSCPAPPLPYVHLVGCPFYRKMLLNAKLAKRRRMLMWHMLIMNLCSGKIKNKPREVSQPGFCHSPRTRSQTDAQLPDTLRLQCFLDVPAIVRVFWLAASKVAVASYQRHRLAVLESHLSSSGADAVVPSSYALNS